MCRARDRDRNQKIVLDAPDQGMHVRGKRLCLPYFSHGLLAGEINSNKGIRLGVVGLVVIQENSENKRRPEAYSATTRPHRRGGHPPPVADKHLHRPPPRTSYGAHTFRSSWSTETLVPSIPIES
jgi:hypothetical protein